MTDSVNWHWTFILFWVDNVFGCQILILLEIDFFDYPIWSDQKKWASVKIANKQ